MADGPGELHAAEMGSFLRLRAGSLQGLAPFSVGPWMDGWTDRAGEAVVAAAGDECGPGSAKYFGGSAGQMFPSLLSRALAAVVAERHGGALVVLSPEAANDAVRIKYHAENMDLGHEAAAFWISCIRAQEGGDRERRRWTMSLNQLLERARTVGHLASIDGCVVMTPGFRVLGFGGQILTDERQAANSSLVFSRIKTEDPWPVQDGSTLGGMRHRSAFNLVKSVPQARAFVVSQDGDLTAFYSDDEKAYCARGIMPHEVAFS